MPAQLNAIVDKLLTNVSNMPASNDDADFICERTLPVIDVVQDSGKLAKYGTGFLKIQASLMGGRGQAKRVDLITRDTDSYQLEKHGLEGIVTEEDYRNVEDPFDAESDEVMGIRSALWLEKEKTLADSLLSSSVMTNGATLSGNAQFSDYDNSDPLGKSKAAHEAVKGQCAKQANAIVMGWQVKNALKYHPAILESLGFTMARAGLLSDEDLCKAFDVKKILVGSVMYDSTDDGVALSLAHVWGKHMLFCVLPDSAQKYQTSVGYLVKRAGEGFRQVYKSPINNPPGSKSIILQDRHDLIIKPAAGYLYTNAVA